MSKETVFLTIVSQNYVPQARCLFESLRNHHSSARYLLCLLEEEAEPDIIPEGDVQVILAKDVVGDDFYDLAYKYSLVEMSAAVKPFAMRHMIESGAQRVIYIDPDCYLYAPLTEVFDLLEDGSNIVVTPHATHPIDDDKKPNEIDFLVAGGFNLGFIAVRKCDETLRFLTWWADRLHEHCVIDPPSGLFLDQKWLDLAPSFFSGVAVLRHPGYNVAYWNAFQRQLEQRPGGWHVDGEILRFFHFSGLPTDDVSLISHHQNRLDGRAIGAFATELQTYLARLASYALKPSQERVYSYSLVWMGEPIESQALRTALRRAKPARITGLSDFQNEQPIIDLLAPHPALPPDEMFPVSRLIYDALLDAGIARHHPLFTAEDRAKFLIWVLTEGYDLLQIDRRLLPWRELLTPVPGAVGGRLAIPPIMWLMWLSDPALRRTASFNNEKAFAHLLLELQKQVDKGERPAWLLPIEFTRQSVVGEGPDSVTVAQYAVWSVREDLQDAFDLETVSGRIKYLDWCAGPSCAVELPWMAKLIVPGPAGAKAS